MVKLKKTTEKNANKLRSTRRVPSVQMLKSSLLLTDINDDCLAEIMKYLDIHSLLKMLKLGAGFEQIVLNRIIPLQTVNVSEFSKKSSVMKLFEKLGHSMTRLQMSIDDIQFTAPNYSRFMEFLRLVTYYGQPGKLKQLMLSSEGNDDKSIPPELFSLVRPFFINVHTLHFDVGKVRNPSFDQFMNNFPKENLSVLHLRNVLDIGDWLNIESMPKLRELHLHMNPKFMHHIDTINHERLMRFIAAKPALTTFNYVGRNSEAIFNAVSQHIPGIERLGEVKNLSVAMNDDDDDIHHITQSIRQKWNYLNGFKRLKFLSLSSRAANFSNCGEIFRNLANQNTVDHLELMFAYNHGIHTDPVRIDDLKRFSSLKSLCLVEHGKGDVEHFLDQLFENLTGLESCKFSGTRSIKQATITNLIQRARHLRVLTIDCKVTSFSKLLYKKMLKIREDVINAMDEPLRPSGPLVVYIDRNIAVACISELANKYAPTKIALMAKSS